MLKIVSVPEMGWLRRIAGINGRERKRNEDIRKFLGNRETIIQKIRMQRLRWFGHVSRIMDVRRPPLQALSTKVSRYRSKGRPRKRWIDCIREHVTQQDGVTQVTVEKARDWQQWREFVQPHRRKPLGV